MFRRIISIALVFIILSLATPAIASKPTANANEIMNEGVSADNVTENTEETITDVVTETVPETTPETIPETTPAISIEPTEETQKEKENFSADITFTRQYISDGYVMPYALYTPSTAENAEKIPLIVWLHGSGEVGCSEETFFKRGLPAVMNEWQLDGFNAYIIAPHLSGSWNSGRWNSETSKNYLQCLIDRVVSEYNVDTENVIIMGHSLGGQGALYMAHELPMYFSRCVVLSGYAPGTDNTEINIPTIGYVGMTSSGEDGSSVSYMKKYVAPVFGEDSCFFIAASHGGLPKAAFELDVNNNNRSDMVEWMFGEMELADMQIS